VTSVVDVGEYDAARWYRILDEQQVTVWYTAPTAIRMLMRVGPEAARAHDLGSLRFVASVGEPLNPEAVEWGVEVLGRPIHDNWWQTETGGIMIANFAACDVKPGSMGLPLPGIDVALLARDDGDDRQRDQERDEEGGGEGGVLLRGGDPVVIDEPDVEGHLAIRAGWPSMFRAYLDQPERYERCFAGDWYVTGDLARQDGDGYLWFVGRADDVIKSAGHLVGPFEVESTLLEHPAVAEAGVIGVPDPVAGEVVKAFVSLNPGYEADEDLRRELLGFARARLGPAIAPRSIEFDPELPHTRSGKIMRRLLKARELGLPAGDLSTLETSS
jgi:acetyl-CoA synthetase